MISREGINGAPAWSPDGKRLAITLSFEGNPEIYLLTLSNGQLSRVTNSDAIDTEPVWLDDNTLIFTSDRSGSPQIYETSSRGGRAKRLTFEGRYNASAAVSPDGSIIAFVHGSDIGYQIATLDRSSGLFQTLTEGSLDESPSFAPNGSMIIYGSRAGGKGVLAAVSSDARRERKTAAKPFMSALPRP